MFEEQAEQKELAPEQPFLKASTCKHKCSTCQKRSRLFWVTHYSKHPSRRHYGLLIQKGVDNQSTLLCWLLYQFNFISWKRMYISQTSPPSCQRILFASEKVVFRSALRQDLHYYYFTVIFRFICITQPCNNKTTSDADLLPMSVLVPVSSEACRRGSLWEAANNNVPCTLSK